MGGWDEFVDHDPESYFKVNGKALNDYYEKKEESRVVVDYIGPSIDTGFRLASLCDARKLIISIDVAYIISITMPASILSVERHDLLYHGSVPLKGVLGGGNYPVFWIDTRGGKLPALEDKLTRASACVRDEVIELCEQFYLDYGLYIFKPFIDGDVEGHLNAIPENYRDILKAYSENFGEEEVTLVEPPREADAETGPDSSTLESVVQSLSEQRREPPEAGR